jgi:hypothetical protein
MLGVFPPSEQEVLEKLMKHDEMQIYSTWNSEVTYLSKKDIKDLTAKQPVIYGNVDTDVYRVVFDSKSGGLLVLFDYDDDVIIKQFEILNAQLA